MPIVDVQIVGALGSRVRTRVARRIADAVGTALGAPPMHTWVRVHRLLPADYAESDGGPPKGVLPVFVSVLLRRPPRGRARAAQAMAVTKAVARASGRPAENVHVIYRAAAAGRAAFGGRLLG